MYLKHTLMCLAAAILFVGSVAAQNPTGSPQSQPQGQPGTPQPGATPEIQPMEQMMDPLASDKKFAKEAAEGSVVEVELGKLAAEKGSTEAVKEFGKRMVEDHGKAGEDLQQAASQANIPVTSEMPRKARKAQEKLSKLSGAEFDREYAKMMLKEHKNDVKAFEKQSKNGKVPELKAFAAKTLPTLQEHQKLAEEMEAATKQMETAKK